MDPRLAMLASVDPRSRVVGFQLLKMDGPNGEVAVGVWPNGARCGIEPARRRDSRAEDEEAPPFPASTGSKPGEGDL